MSFGQRVGVKSYTSAMAAPGSGGRLVALPLAWLAGVALQLQQRELWRLDIYLAITAAAVVVALASMRSRRAFAPLVVAALSAGFAAGGKPGVVAPRRSLAGKARGP